MIVYAGTCSPSKLQASQRQGITAVPQSSLGMGVPRTGHNLSYLGSDSWQSYLPELGPSGFRWRWMPFLDLRISWRFLMGGREGSGANSKRSKQRPVTTFTSFMANCCPMQFLGPAEKGMKANGWRPLTFSEEKRRGSKTSGWGHTELFLCRA